MGAVTTVGDFLDRLCALLAARSGLDAVNVFSSIVDEKSAGTETVFLAAGEIEAIYSYRTIPKLEVHEKYVVPCQIPWVHQPGADEAVIKAARDRLLAIFEEVHDQIATSAANSVTCRAALGVDDARIVSWTLSQGIGASTRAAGLRFSIEVSATFTPS